VVLWIREMAMTRGQCTQLPKVEGISQDMDEAQRRRNGLVVRYVLRCRQGGTDSRGAQRRGAG